ETDDAGAGDAGDDAGVQIDLADLGSEGLGEVEDAVGAQSEVLGSIDFGGERGAAVAGGAARTAGQASDGEHRVRRGAVFADAAARLLGDVEVVSGVGNNRRRIVQVRLERSEVVVVPPEAAGAGDGGDVSVLDATDAVVRGIGEENAVVAVDEHAGRIV